MLRHTFTQWTMCVKSHGTGDKPYRTGSVTWITPLYLMTWVTLFSMFLYSSPFLNDIWCPLYLMRLVTNLITRIVLRIEFSRHKQIKFPMFRSSVTFIYYNVIQLYLAADFSGEQSTYFRALYERRMCVSLFHGSEAQTVRTHLDNWYPYAVSGMKLSLVGVQTTLSLLKCV
jgi:hypothetical protein